MVRLATDALAVACILAGGAAGTAITLAALDDDRPAAVPERDVMRHAVVSVSGIGMSGVPCVSARAPRVFVTTPDGEAHREVRGGDVRGHEVRVRELRRGHDRGGEVRARAVPGRTVIASSSGPCSELDRASVERHRARLEAARVEVEASRARVEEVRRQMDRQRERRR